MTDIHSSASLLQEIYDVSRSIFGELYNINLLTSHYPLFSSMETYIWLTERIFSRIKSLTMTSLPFYSLAYSSSTQDFSQKTHQFSQDYKIQKIIAWYGIGLTWN